MYGGYAKRNCNSTGKSEGRDVLPKRLQAKNGADAERTLINKVPIPYVPRHTTGLLISMNLTR